MRHRCTALAASLTLMLGAGCGNLDRIDRVHDLRLLGIRAEPPDQALRIDPSLGVLGTPQPVQLTALVADPNGGGRPIQYSLAVCAGLDNGRMTPSPSAGATFGGAATAQATYRCRPEGYQVLAQGTAFAKAGWVEVSATLQASNSLLAAALARDDYHGFGGLRLPVQVQIGAGKESVIGTKLVVFTLADPNTYVANQNPQLTGIEVGTQPWTAGAPYVFAASQRPSAKGWNLQPTFDPNLQVPYTQTSYTGSPLQFTERWRFDYFGTVGTFTPATTGGQQPISLAPEPANTNWLPAPGAQGPATFWFVVRDGRGGENWLIREARLTP